MNSIAIAPACQSGAGPGPARPSSSSGAKHAAATTFITKVDRQTPARPWAARLSDSAAATYSRLLANGNRRWSGRSVAGLVGAAIERADGSGTIAGGTGRASAPLGRTRAIACGAPEA